MPKKSKLLSLVMSIVLLFSVAFIPMGVASAEEELSEEDLELIELLTAIENMPDEIILQGEDAIKAHLESEVSFHLELNENGESVVFRVASVSSIAGCVGAVGTALVVNFTPAKILKIKSALKSVGGATKFVKAVKPYYQMSREDKLSKTASLNQAVRLAAKDAGPDTREALLDLFGVSSVVGSCAAAFGN
ncbi:hypothetical protein [Exiguobacterium alkaliphilum]|uniref:hypothetical protein n=1 Tax=Exiguobacterium alkaliphilum TaxID=1428684 RepID=UPI00403B1B19